MNLEEKYNNISKYFVSDRFQECKRDESKQSFFKKEMEFIFEHESLFNDFISIRETIESPGTKNKTNSYISYILGITDCPPDFNNEFKFKDNVILTRFSPPDVDIDFEEREPVFNYLSERYGKENTAFIITYGECKAKKSVQMAFKIKNITIGNMDADQTSKFISKQVQNEDSFEESINQPDLKDYLIKFKDVFDLAKSVHKIKVVMSQHAAGILITDQPISEYVPLRKTKTGMIVSEYDKEDVENIGLLKYDILKISTLGHIHKCVDMIKEKTGQVINIEELQLNDENVLRLYQNRDTAGIFQMEKYTMMKTLESVHVHSFADIAACNAIGRPGPINEGYPEEYGRRQGNHGLIQYYHPILKDCLKDTYGLMIYQEQVTKTSQLLAGLSATQADKIRKFIGKKQTDEEKVKPIRDMFINGCEKTGIINQEFSLKIWKIMEGFGQYAFNKAHSVAYAHNSYWTAWLKTYYYPYFMATLMTTTLDDGQADTEENINRYSKELKKRGFTLLTPDVNLSKSYYEVIDNTTIIEPFHITKGIGKNVGIVISKYQPYINFEDFLEKTSDQRIGKDIMEMMISNGCFKCFGNKEKFMDQFSIFSEKRKKGTGNKKMFQSHIETHVPIAGKAGMKILNKNYYQEDIV